MYSHCLKSPLRGLLILFWEPLSFVMILIPTFQCLRLKFNLPVKFIWFRYTPQYAQERERELEALWRSPCYICGLNFWWQETGKPVGNILLPASCVSACVAHSCAPVKGKSRLQYQDCPSHGRKDRIREIHVSKSEKYRWQYLRNTYEKCTFIIWQIQLTTVLWQKVNPVV